MCKKNLAFATLAFSILIIQSITPALATITVGSGVTLSPGAHYYVGTNDYFTLTEDLKTDQAIVNSDSFSINATILPFYILHWPYDYQIGGDVVTLRPPNPVILPSYHDTLVWGTSDFSSGNNIRIENISNSYLSTAPTWSGVAQRLTLTCAFSCHYMRIYTGSFTAPTRVYNSTHTFTYGLEWTYSSHKIYFLSSCTVCYFEWYATQITTTTVTVTDVSTISTHGHGPSCTTGYLQIADTHLQAWLPTYDTYVGFTSGMISASASEIDVANNRIDYVEIVQTGEGQCNTFGLAVKSGNLTLDKTGEDITITAIRQVGNTPDVFYYYIAGLMPLFVTYDEGSPGQVVVMRASFVTSAGAYAVCNAPCVYNPSNYTLIIKSYPSSNPTISFKYQEVAYVFHVRACGAFDFECWVYPLFFIGVYLVLIEGFAIGGGASTKAKTYLMMEALTLASVVAVLMGMINIMFPIIFALLGAIYAVRSS